MSTIVTRAGKGSPLTHNEVDANFTNLNADKLEVGAAFNAAVAATPAVTANTAKVSNATHTGDATGATALTLATVNANVGSFGSATQVMTQTVNAKGLTTAAANVSIAIPASQVTDFSTAVAATAAVTANTAKVTNANHTGDVTGSGALTIAADAVTNAKLANVATATIKGRTTAGTGDPEDLTGTQATALLDAFTSAAKGLAPASGGGTTNFLRADGTWAAPGGGGGSSLTVQDEGVTLSTAVTTINFTGAGVTATGTTTVTVDVPGGGGGTYDYGKTLAVSRGMFFN